VIGPEGPPARVFRAAPGCECWLRPSGSVPSSKYVVAVWARIGSRTRGSRMLLSGAIFDADIAERYGWVNRTLDDGDLDSFVDTLARRLASFDRKTLAAAKAQINRFGIPTAAELQSSNDMIFPMLALPDAQARRAKLRAIGYGVRSDFELNFGRYLPSFGPADHDEANTDRAKAS